MTTAGSPDRAGALLPAILGDPTRVAEIPRDGIVPLLCQLSSLQIALASQLLRGERLAGETAVPTEDRLLTAGEAATILGVTPKWLYRHQKLPFVRKLSRKALRVSENGLRRWLAARKA